MSIIKQVPKFKQRSEYLKCASDPVYFLNTYGKVFDAEKQMISDMTCFDYQEDILDDFIDFRFNITLKSRQTGLSVITAGYCAWRLMFGKDERVLIIANDGAGAIRFLETCKQFVDYLPDFLKPPKVGTSIYKTENKKMLQFYNNCQVEAKAASPQAGRGESLTLLVLDEVAFIKDAPDIWKAASTALSMTKGDAILISTPWGTGNLYHDIWTKAEAKINDFHAVEIHWTQNPIASKNLEWRIDDDGEKYPWSPWYEEQCTRLNNDPISIAQELDLSFEGSKHLVVDAKILRKYKDRIKNEGIEPLCYFDWKVDSSNFTYDITPFYIWELPIEGHNYIVGGDVSRGDGRDFSTLQILDVETMTQVGELQVKVDPDQLADIVYKVAQVYNNAFVAIEVNSMGSATTFRLKNQLKYTNQFFCKNYKDFYVKASSYREAAMYKDGALVPGFQTTTKTRPLMMANLIQIMRERQVIVNSKRLLNEFDTFIKIKDKEQHEKGFNDDLIFAWAIALYMRNTEYENATKSREQAKQMLKYFNLNGKSPMKDNTPASVRKPKKGVEEGEEIKKKGISPIIFGGSRKQAEEDDTSWLYD
jgi:hypothetical protein|tara:strand:- start:431 stop:2200 length:1770 start_codon:yes stop_codon:yes gene_type:complete